MHIFLSNLTTKKTYHFDRFIITFWQKKNDKAHSHHTHSTTMTIKKIQYPVKKSMTTSIQNYYRQCMIIVKIYFTYFCPTFTHLLNYNILIVKINKTTFQCKKKKGKKLTWAKPSPDFFLVLIRPYLFYVGLFLKIYYPQKLFMKFIHVNFF